MQCVGPTDEDGIARVRDIQDGQPRADADVGIVPLQGYTLHPAADLAHELDTLCFLVDDAFFRFLWQGVRCSRRQR